MIRPHYNSQELADLSGEPSLPDLRWYGFHCDPGMRWSCQQSCKHLTSVDFFPTRKAIECH